MDCASNKSIQTPKPMKKILLVMMLLIFAGQMAVAQKVKFRKIDKDELEEKVHPRDTEAEAAILHTYGRRFYTFNNNEGWFKLNTYVHQRIKIYNQDGLSWADFQIPYSSDGSFSKFRAFTYNLVDGKVVETKLENNEIFTEEFGKHFKRRKFAMPAAAPGSIIDIEYEIIEPSSIAHRSFYLQYSIPVNYIEIEVEIPEYYRFNKSIKGLPLKMQTKNSSKSGTISFVSASGARDVGGSGSRNPTMQSSSITYGINVDHYIAQNVPALKDEPFVTSMNNYRTSLSYELSFVQIPGGRSTNYSTSWNDIADRMMSHENFGQQIEVRVGELNQLVQEVSGLETDEKIKAIYFHVRDNYQWNESISDHTDKGVRKLISDKTGNSADINLLLINLLNRANVDVYPVVLSTRANGILNITHPSYAQINYVIAAVKKGDAYMFLDATDKYLLPGNLPLRAMNLDGVLITPDRKGHRIDITNPNHGTTNITILAELDQNLVLKGKYRAIYSDYDAAGFMAKYKEAEKKEGYLKQLADLYPDLELAEYRIEGLNEKQNQITEYFDIELENQLSEVGDMLYLNPMLLWKKSSNEFKTEKREFPVFYNNTGADRYMFSIKLPEGFEVESLPKPTRLALPENMGSFTYNVVNNSGNIVIQYHFTRSASVIPPQHYPALRNFIDLMIEKQAEKIVLKKI